MMRFLRRRKIIQPSFVNISMIAMVVLFLASCGIFGPSDSSDDSSTTEEGEEARIIVVNNYGEALDIYMDGVFQFSLENGEEDKIKDVSHDEHLMEAKRPGTSEVVDSKEIDVVSDTDYTWTIDDSPDINVTNKYGVTLKIYMDGIYQFDLVDEENRWIIDVSFGERFLKALKASNDAEVASTTIDVEANKDYSWVIE